MSENIKSIYKVGDKVTIRKTYHPGFECTDYPVLITKNMLDRCGGNTYTIKSVHQSATRYVKGYLEPFLYVLEGGKEAEDLFWSAAMFEESNHLLAKKDDPNKLTDKVYNMSEDIKSIYKVGDKVTVRKTYHPGFQGSDYPHGFTNSMLDECGGKTFTIKSVQQSESSVNLNKTRKGYLEPFWYVLKGGEEVEGLCWCALMFEESNHLLVKKDDTNKLTDKVYEILEDLQFNDGYAVVQRTSDRKFNWIDKDKNLLSPDWFLGCDDFCEGFAQVKRDEDQCWNWIDTNGKFLSADWMQHCSHFNEGFAAFKETDERWNWVDKKGNILSKDWYYYCTDFHNGFAKVAKSVDGCRWNRVVNFVNKNGDLLSPIWFRDECGSFYGGRARVTRTDDGMLNWLKEDGEFLSREWFRDCCSFKGGFAAVRRENGYWNWIDKAGKILSKNKDFYDCGDFLGDGFAKIIHKNGKSSWMGKDGKVYTTKEKENFIKTGMVINTSEEPVSEKPKLNLGGSKKSNEVKLCLLENDNFSISVKKKRDKLVKLNFK